MDDLEDLEEIAEQIGGTVEDAKAYIDYLESENQKDLEFADFLEENGFEGVDLDSGEFY